LHPNTPMRNGELLVRRSLIESGLVLMVSRGLAERSLGVDGITYSASDEASPFLDCLSSSYSKSLKSRAEWANDQFGYMDDDSLRTFFDNNFERWSREFQSNSSDVDRFS